MQAGLILLRVSPLHGIRGPDCGRSCAESKMPLCPTGLKGSMRLRIAALLALLAALGSPRALAQTPQELRSLFDANQAFALRDAVKHENVPVFFRGAVEESLNQTEPARRDLEKAIAADSHGKQAFEAHEMLANMSWRNGLYHDALVEADALIGVAQLFQIIGRVRRLVLVGDAVERDLELHS